MTMNLDVVGSRAEPVARSWTSTDALIYALGVGAGAVDPETEELEFTTENSAGVEQQVLPTYATVIGRGGAGGGWQRQELGDFDPAQLVHAEQSVVLHASIPVEGSLQTETTVRAIYDKGSGALVVMDAASVDRATGTPLFTTTTSLFVRGEGGFGGARGPSTARPTPDRRPDHVVSYGTRRDQALLYRLSGDRNPLHSDPKFAARAGFERPILQGLCTYGFTGRALLHAMCNSDVRRFGEMHARFSRPTFPGDTLTVSMWAERDEVRFRTDNQGGETVLDAGVFRRAPSG